MKTNITIDNYEAFLLDYMEGNLSPDEAVQLKAFVAAQGMDWNELTEELPHLEAPAVTYQGKENLKKKGTIVPLYVKIASAAAAAGLLLTVTLWPEKSMPRVEPIANLKPIEVSKINTNEPIVLLPRRATESINPLPRTGIRGDDLRSEGHLTSKRTAMPLLAELPTKTATALQIDLPWTNFDEPDFDLMAYRMNTELAMMSFDGNEFSDDAEEETAKKELNLAATDIALTAYYRADERFEEAKENWQDKREE